MITRYKIQANFIVSRDGVYSDLTKDRIDEVFSTEQEALDYVKTLPVKKQMGEYTRDYQYKVVAIDYTHANMHGWSDVTPFEIVRVVSPKTIEVRAMIAEQDESFKPEIIPGGFAGHCVNQGQQKWNYKSAPEGMVLRARLRKDGNFHSNYGKHVLSTEPRKFYDYNF